MKDKKKRKMFPRSLIKSLSEDIRSLMQTNEGKLLSIEILEEIPFEIRPHVLESLSSFYTEEMVQFFQLVKEEYGKEHEQAVLRALEKLQMAGLKADEAPQQTMEFHRAFVTRTRHSGQITLDVAWKAPNHTIDVECFFLSFNADGIHGFFVISEMSMYDYRKDREKIPDMVEISREEACFLVQEAHRCNVVHMTRPAPGRFIFKKYLEQEVDLDPIVAIPALMERITPELAPRELVNTFLYAWRYRDEVYLESVLRNSQGLPSVARDYLNEIWHSGVLLVEGQALDARIGRGRCIVKAYSVHVDEEEIYKTDLTLHLVKSRERWFIESIHRDSVTLISDEREGNPFQDKVECAVYEILDMDNLFNILENINDIREVGELPFGVHLRVMWPEEDVAYAGVYFLSGVLADVVINGDELVLIARDKSGIEEIDALLMAEPGTVDSQSRHLVEIITAYSYLSGQYLNFDDMLSDKDEELFFQDGLKFLTARYGFNDRDRVQAKLAQISGPRYRLTGDVEVFYEYDRNETRLLHAEYVLGGNWVTVSAFGEKELGQARERFEKDIKECLAFEGMEVRCEGLFEWFTPEVRKQYPGLEPELKRAYLDKWYESNLKPLSGMTPHAASRSVEGKQLLWKMFKDMQRKEKIKKELGVRSFIEIKEYIRKVDIKTEGHGEGPFVPGLH